MAEMTSLSTLMRRDDTDWARWLIREEAQRSSGVWRRREAVQSWLLARMAFVRILERAAERAHSNIGHFEIRPALSLARRLRLSDLLGVSDVWVNGWRIDVRMTFKPATDVYFPPALWRSAVYAPDMAAVLEIQPGANADRAELAEAVDLRTDQTRALILAAAEQQQGAVPRGDSALGFNAGARLLDWISVPAAQPRQLQELAECGRPGPLEEVPRQSGAALDHLLRCGACEARLASSPAAPPLDGSSIILEELAVPLDSALMAPPVRDDSGRRVVLRGANYLPVPARSILLLFPRRQGGSPVFAGERWTARWKLEKLDNRGLLSLRISNLPPDTVGQAADIYRLAPAPSAVQFNRIQELLAWAMQHESEELPSAVQEHAVPLRARETVQPDHSLGMLQPRPPLTIAPPIKYDTLFLAIIVRRVR